MNATQQTVENDDIELNTDTVNEIETGDTLSVDGETVHVLGTWIPPLLALPELRVIRGDGSTDKLVVADDEVGFRSNVVDEDFPDDARIPVERVERATQPAQTFQSAISNSDVIVTDSRDSPIHPDGDTGHFVGGVRSDGHAVELFRDTGEGSDVSDYGEYGEETFYAYIRPFPEPDTAMVATYSRRDESEFVERTGVYKREDDGKFGALAGANGFAGWYTATEVAQFVNAKRPENGQRFGQCRSMTDYRVEWHDDGYNAKVKFTRIDD